MVSLTMGGFFFNGLPVVTMLVSFFQSSWSSSWSSMSPWRLDILWYIVDILLVYYDILLIYLKTGYSNYSMSPHLGFTSCHRGTRWIVSHTFEWAWELGWQLQCLKLVGEKTHLIIYGNEKDWNILKPSGVSVDIHGRTSKSCGATRSMPWVSRIEMAAGAQWWCAGAFEDGNDCPRSQFLAHNIGWIAEINWLSWLEESLMNKFAEFASLAPKPNLRIKICGLYIYVYIYICVHIYIYINIYIYIY